jgi:hypothetical protein
MFKGLPTLAAGPMYELLLSTKYDSGRREVMEAYVVDRIPQGPMARCCELQDNLSACDPSGVALLNQTRNKPLRYLLRLPEEVKQKYQTNFRSDYVNSYTLPGFASWMLENGYRIIDMHHQLPDKHSGFWIQYMDSEGLEFPAREFTMQQSRSNAVPEQQTNSTRKVVIRRR